MKYQANFDFFEQNVVSFGTERPPESAEEEELDKELDGEPEQDEVDGEAEEVQPNEEVQDEDESGTTNV
jgi:hypothetical protein